MRKMMMLLLIGLLSFAAIGCNSINEPASEVQEEEALVEEEIVEEVKEPEINGTLEDIMERLYAGVDHELPVLLNNVIDEESIAYFTGTEEISYLEGLGSEPMISSIAHSVVLLRLEEGTDVEGIKNTIKSNVDPMKWICVGVEEDEVIVDNIGDIVVLIMDKEAEALHQSFVNLVE